MALEEVSGSREARKLLKEYRKEERAEAHGPMRHASEVAGPSGAGSAGVVGEGTDGIDLDPAEVAEAERRLGELYAEIALYKAQAEDLAGPLGDGRGPVAVHMRKAFGLRGGADIGGVHLALQQYLDELARLREAIAQVGVVHQASDEEAMESMRLDGQGVSDV
ncbi:MAG: hypothetical protein ACRDQB_00990 [Thermocrispum sp.]